MPDRRRFALIATPLLALLAALLLGASAAWAQEAGGASAPTVTLESSTPTSLTVTWDAVAGTQFYDVRWGRPNADLSPSNVPTGTRFTITGLSPGLRYMVQVQATGHTGATLAWIRGTFRTPQPAPATFTATAATATSLTVAWTPPPGWTPSDYQLSWRVVGNTPFLGTVNPAATARSHTITGLTAGTRYLVRLTARNAGGRESPPQRFIATATDVPCAIGVAVPSPESNTALVKDCTALLAVKDTLRGMGTLNWAHTLPIAEWDGVTVAGRPRRVTVLRLAGRGLTGVVPAGLGDLSGLTRIDLTWNKLRGAIPAALGSLPQLTDLALYRNRLSGGIPAELGTLAKLERLSLSQNFLTGAIPTALGDLSKLQSLYLYQNRLSGPIPAELVQLTALTDLYLSENALTGCLPRKLQQVTRNDLANLGLDSCPLPSTTLSYGAPTTTGSVTDDGDYAFLTDPDDLTTMVTTYEGLRDGSTTGLVINKTDSAGTSQEVLYDLVQAGDIVEWRKASDCWVRYQVTEVKADPAGTVSRKQFAITWKAYAFTGCTGTVATDTAASMTWSPEPNFLSPRITVPVRHGSYQIIPYDWTGATQEAVRVAPPARQASGTPEGSAQPTWPSDDPAEVRQHPLWDEPTVPTAWTLSEARADDAYYWASYGTNGTYAADITVLQTSARPVSWISGLYGSEEARVIDGHTAILETSFVGSGVWILHEATGIQYFVYVHHTDGPDSPNIEDAIAIARSLYQ